MTGLPSCDTAAMMKSRSWLCALGLLVTAAINAGHAEDFTLTNGKVIKGDLSRVEPDGLVVATDDGIEKISFLLLPRETQKRYNFDLKKADEYRAQQAAAHKQMLEQQATAIRERVAQVETLQGKNLSLAEQQRRAQIEADAITATAKVLQGTSKGSYVRLTTETGHAARTMLDKDTRATVSLGDAYVYDLRAIDGDSWQGKLYPAGLYTYKTYEGVEHTMRAYAISSDVALEKSEIKTE